MTLDFDGLQGEQGEETDESVAVLEEETNPRPRRNTRRRGSNRVFAILLFGLPVGMVVLAASAISVMGLLGVSAPILDLLFARLGWYFVQSVLGNATAGFGYFVVFALVTVPVLAGIIGYITGRASQ